MSEQANGQAAESNDERLSPNDQFQKEQKRSLAQPSLFDTLQQTLDQYRQQIVQFIRQQDPTKLGAVVILILAVLTSPPGRVLSKWVLYLLINIGKTTIGVCLGVGLGLGLATHISDSLEQPPTEHQQHASILRPSASSLSQVAPRRLTSLGDDALQDEQTYSSLMQASGYDVARFRPYEKLLRGQVLKKIPGRRYTFDNFAVPVLDELFPNVHANVRSSLGKAMEFIVRDFVGCWYYKADAGCLNPYSDDKDKPPVVFRGFTPQVRYGS